MKNSKKILFALVVILLSSCGNHSENPQMPLTSEDLLFITVIKFTNPSYKDNIMATDNRMYKQCEHDDSVFYACGKQLFKADYIRYADSIKLLEMPPYIELIDDYLMMNWHWTPIFPHCSDKINGNYSQAILTGLKWTDLKDFKQEWERTIPNDHEAIDRVHLFKVKALDDYRGDKSYLQDGWEKHILFRGSVRQIDSMQNIYAECLKQILRNHKYAENESTIRQIE